MQMEKPTKTLAKITWIYGAMCGVCLGVLSIVSQLVGPAMVTFSWTLTMVAFLLVGMLAAKRTGQVRTGILVGLVAGLASGIILSVISLLEGGAQPNLSALAITFPLMLGFGAGMGMLGSLLVQMTSTHKASMKIVWTYGAISGVCLGILSITALGLGLPGFSGITLVIVFAIVAFLLAGILAAKRMGQVRTGMLAGLVAGLAGGSCYAHSFGPWY